MIDLKFRSQIAKMTGPLGRGLVRVGLTANRLTLIGVAVGVVASAVVTTGRLFLAGVLGTVACLFDLMDGAAAKAAGTTSKRGNYLDSLADRVSESTMYFGLVVYCLNFRSARLAYVVLLAYMAAQVTSYTRAKADALGVDGKVGFMERAERQITLGLAALIPHTFTVLMVFLAAATTITAVQRIIVVWMRLSRPGEPPSTMRVLAPLYLRRRPPKPRRLARR